MPIVVHSVLIFGFIWIVVRLVGKRELSQLSAFDFILLVVTGDLVAEGVISEDTSLTGAVVAVATFTVLTVVVSWLSWRMPRARGVFEGVPTLLIRDGVILDEALVVERLNREDLREAARQNGIRELGDVEWAVLENDGSFSFFERSRER